MSRLRNMQATTTVLQNTIKFEFTNPYIYVYAYTCPMRLTHLIPHRPTHTKRTPRRNAPNIQVTTMVLNTTGGEALNTKRDENNLSMYADDLAGVDETDADDDL